MGWVTLSLRNQTILGQKMQMEGQLLDINQKLMSLQTYASSITNGVMNSGVPSWIGANMTSPYQIAKLQADTFIKQNGYKDPKTGKFYTKGPNGLALLSPQKIFQDYLAQASNKYIEQLRATMHRIEKELMHQKEQITIRMQMLDAEYNSNKSAITSSIQSSAPKYV